MAPSPTSARTRRAYLNALLVLGVVLGIALLIVGARVRGASGHADAAELRTGTQVDAVVVSAVHTNGGGTYVVSFTDRGHAYRMRLTSTDDDPRYSVGAHVTVYTNGGDPPRVVTEDGLTSDGSGTAGGTVLIGAGIALILFGGLLALRRGPTSASASAGGATTAHVPLRYGDPEPPDLEIAPHRDPEMPEFEVVPRGYDRVQVTTIFRRAHEVLESGSAADRAALLQLVRAGCRTVARGYNRVQVDMAFDGLARILES